jgi:hypothetical protein
MATPLEFLWRWLIIVLTRKSMNLLEKFPRLNALRDGGAWTLIVLGLILFLIRIPMPSGWLINLPLAVTVIQTAGLIFAIAGLQILVSKLVWPGISVSTLVNTVQSEDSTSSTASGLTLLGLLIYNGLTTIAIVIWLLYSLGLNTVGGNV